MNTQPTPKEYAIPTTATLLLACTYLLITLTPLHPQ